jgi:hypothetical protein
MGAIEESHNSLVLTCFCKSEKHLGKTIIEELFVGATRAYNYYL